jgi:hypothetical protein
MSLPNLLTFSQTAIARKKVSRLVLILALISALIYIARLVPSNDFSAPYVDDGRDNDLKIVRNAEHLKIDPNTFVCSDWEFTPEAIYGLFGIARIGRFRQTLQGLNANGYYVSPGNLKGVAGKKWPGSRFVPVGTGACEGERRPENIYLIGRVVAEKQPGRFGLWLRARRGDQFITFYKVKQFRPEKLERWSPLYGFGRDTGVLIALDEYGALGSQVAKSFEPDPSIVIALENDNEN